MESNLYELKLHETLTIDVGLRVTRVPGGWLYFKVGGDFCFVPYDNEYAPQAPDQDLPF